MREERDPMTGERNRPEDGLAYADDERLAVFYERHLVGDCAYRAPWIVAEMVEPLAVAGERWLDVGAGTGLVGRALAERGVKLELSAVDASAAMLDLVPAALYAERVRADCRERLPFGAATFDGAVACGLFEHIAASGPVWRELARILKPRAHLVFTFPPAGALLSQGPQLWSHDADEVRRDLEAAGFEWRDARDIRAYRSGDEGWVTYRLVGARRASGWAGRHSAHGDPAG
jgi:predicted TPR repeat methyltransferase